MNHSRRKKSHTVKKSVERIVKVLCCVFILLMLTVNAAVCTFFRYYSMVSVTVEDDYSDLVISPSDEDIADTSNVVIELPEESIFRDKDILNILLIGTDERTIEFNKASRADTIMMLSLNKKSKGVKLVSFERDTYVKIPHRNPNKINATFQYGGAKLLMQTLRTHFNVDVEKYIRVNFSVFQKLVDEIGGVDVELTREEASIIAYRTNLTVKEGKNHLNGEAALIYSRIRAIDSDWERVKRQRRVIISIKNSFKDKSIGELKHIADACLPYVQTNLSASECAELLMNIIGYAKSDVEQMTIPDWSTFQTLEKVNFKSNSKILRDFLYQ